MKYIPAAKGSRVGSELEWQGVSFLTFHIYYQVRKHALRSLEFIWLPRNLHMALSEDPRGCLFCLIRYRAFA